MLEPSEDRRSQRPALRTGALDTFVLSERKPSLLVVPSGAGCPLEDETKFVSAGANIYNGEPDEVRVPLKVFTDFWIVGVR